MTIAILGAGWLGTAVANATGGDAIATTRDGHRPDGLDPAIAVLPLRLDDATLPPAIAEARVWVVAVAPGRTQDRRAVYVDGPRALFEHLPRTAVQRVVWIGSTSALPDDDGDVDESCSTWPDGDRGRVQREAEAIVERAAVDHERTWMILRMGGLWGPGRELGRLFGQVAPTDGDRRTNLVHRDDAVAATLAAIRSDRSGIVHVVSDDHCTRREMIDAARAARGDPPAAWASEPGAPRGKRVIATRLHAWLGVRAHHRHQREDGPLATPRGRA